MTLFFLTLIAFASIALVSSSKTSLKQVNTSLPEGVKVFYQGWAKYYYSTKPIKTPKEFFQNNQYFGQRYPAEVSKKSDNFGSFVIPDKSSFFVVVFKDNIAVYSARDEIVRHEVDSLLFENLGPVPEDDFMMGSIKDLGKHKAGDCLRLKVSTPAAFNAETMNKSQWVFCFPDKKQKGRFLKQIVKMKVILQRENNQIVSALGDEGEASGVAGDKKPGNNKDGKMVMLQDWSDCTLKCGGGKSFQQWMCIPPQKGGKPCEGESIKEKACNTDPCPVIKAGGGPPEEPKEKFVKPVIKIARYSQRFNRFTRCIIKETDIFRMDASNNKYPARLIMNNKTLTIYQDDEYINKDYTFDLQKTNFKLLPEFCCFELTDTLRQSKFCGFDTACGDPDLNLFAKEMQRDFNDFKTTCNVGRQTHILSNEDEQKIAAAKTKKVSQRNFEVEAEKVEKVNDELEQETDTRVFKQITATQNTGLKALEKEVFIEGLIKQDEQKREADKENKIVDQMEAEKLKRRSINKQIQEKELEQEFVMDQMAAEKDIKSAKKEIAVQIEVNREHLKEAIEKIRKEAKKNRAQLKGKLKNLKTKISKKILRANKAGDKTKCFSGLRDVNVRENYCNAAHPDDYLENEYCKEEENYCYSCCDSEFGLLKPNDRDNCYQDCDKEREKVEAEREKAARGPVKPNQWQWKASPK